MKLIVAIPYNGELTAPFMIEYLYDVVDYFIVIEARQTFSGKRKDVMFGEVHADQFRRKDKVWYVTIDEFPDMPTGWNPYQGMPEHEKPAWFREFYQRNASVMCIPQVLGLAGEELDQTIVYVGDADEIPSKRVFEGIRDGSITNYTEEPLYLTMQAFVYNFNWKYPSPWGHSFVAPYRHIESHAAARLRIRGREADNHLPDGGWHCGNFMSVADIQRKLASFSHIELNTPAINDADNVLRCVRKGVDLFGAEADFRGDTSIAHTELEDIGSLPEGWQTLHEVVVRAQSRC